jgi:hypothetical protein
LNGIVSHYQSEKKREDTAGEISGYKRRKSRKGEKGIPKLVGMGI